MILDETEIVLEETTPVIEEPLTEEKVNLIAPSTDKPLPQTLDDAENILDPDLFKSKEKKNKIEKDLEIGEPLSFNKREKYSFSEWLQLTNNKDVKPKKEEKEAPKQKNALTEVDLEKQVLKEKKFNLIDKFIAKSPKIIPKEKQSPKATIQKTPKFDASELMTETLARVYLEQKKYKKAIQAYRILSLKYPEKSGFFADRIKSVEQIQQENT